MQHGKAVTQIVTLKEESMKPKRVMALTLPLLLYGTAALAATSGTGLDTFFTLPHNGCNLIRRHRRRIAGFRPVIEQA